jgi:histidyl-tRNA synthetase
VVKVNNRKVLDGVLESIGIGGEENAAQRLTVLRAIDKFDRLGLQGVKQLLGQGRWDGGEEGKGDFAKGAGLTTDQFAPIAKFLGAGLATTIIPPGRPHPGKRIGRTVDTLLELFGNNKRADEGIRELLDIEAIIERCDYASRVRVDPTVVRGLEYYTGPVYEVELTFETKDDKGRPVRFGSVGGGGRYDGLVSRFMGQPVPATGFSIGVSRLQAALTALGKLSSKPVPGPVVVTVFDKDRVGDYQRMVSDLRNANIRAELYLGNPKNIGNQLKYADKRNSPCVVIQGGDEKARGEVLIKDLILGAEIAGLSKEREDYLKKQAEAQFAVKEPELVEAVRKLLARHGQG